MCAHRIRSTRLETDQGNWLIQLIGQVPFGVCVCASINQKFITMNACLTALLALRAEDARRSKRM